MSERTLYTCDICQKEFDSAIPKGLLAVNILVGQLHYSCSTVDGYDSYRHTCNSCLDIIARVVKAKFEDTVSKLRQDLMG